MRKLAALLVGAALMMATSAMAVQITGGINFGGLLNLTTTTLGDVTFANADAVDFANTASGIGMNTIQLVTGDFTAIPANTFVTFQDFSFAPTLNPSPVAPLWTLSFNSGNDIYSFDLSSVQVTRSNNSLELFGKGILHATGFDDTVGYWDLTTQNASGNATITLNFSQDTQSAPVPEPGTMMLLGLGIFGLAIFGKRRMNKDV